MAISVSLNGEIFEQVVYSREDDFERLVVENCETIFGEKAIYINAKQRISGAALGKGIIDGFLVDLSDPKVPEFYIVEIELEKHDFDSHILRQINRFIGFCTNPHERHRLARTVSKILQQDPLLADRMKAVIGSNEIFQVIADMLESRQNILMVLDAPKPEVEEMLNRQGGDWEKFVRVQIIKHYQRGEDHILTIEPPFEDLQIRDAISPPPDKGIIKPSQYTEEFHLKDCNENVRGIYKKIKKALLEIKGTIKFNPVKSYIGVIDGENIAFLRFGKEKITMLVLLAEDEVKRTLTSHHHKVAGHRESYWHINKPNCDVKICDAKHFEEIEALLQKVVLRNEKL
jgi:hypothetical protein